MQRVAFLMRVKAGREEEYREAHRPHRIWPSIVDACRRAGIRNYSIFIGGHDGRQLFAYFETDDPARTLATLNDDPANVEWQAHMAPLMDVAGSFQDGESMAFLDEVFHLE
jgi:L-rhamnose mutarotase